MLSQREHDIIDSCIDDGHTIEGIQVVLVNAGFRKRTKRSLSLIVSNKKKKLAELEEKKRKYSDKTELLKYRATSLVNQARARTRHRQKDERLPFDITPSFVYDKLEQGYCELSGLQLYIKPYTPRRETNSRGLHPLTASLDKINPHLYYTKENVRVICLCFNRLLGTSHDGAVIDALRHYVKAYDARHRLQLLAN